MHAAMLDNLIIHDSEKLESPSPFNSSPNKAVPLGNQHNPHPAPSFRARVKTAKRSSEVPFLQPSWPAVNRAASGPVTVAVPETSLTSQKLLFVGFGNSAVFRCFVFSFDVSSLTNQTPSMCQVLFSL